MCVCVSTWEKMKKYVEKCVISLYAAQFMNNILS